MKTVFGLAVAASFAVTGSALGADWDESIDGDLASVADGGTMISLDDGTNEVRGTVGVGGAIDEDFATFTIGAGQMITSITLTEVIFANGNTSTGFRLYADIGSGLEQVSFGSFTAGDVGTDYLTVWDLSDVGGGPGLGPGTYGVLLAEFTAGQQYAYEIEVIPAPGAAGLLAVGGLALARRRR